MNRKVIIGVVAALFIMAGLAAAFAYVVIFEKQSTRKIGENIQVSREWTEVVIEPPLEIEKQIQSISLRIEGARYNSNTKHNQLADGTIIEPEVHLRDSSGKWHIMRGGAGFVSDYDSNSQTFEANGILFTLGTAGVPRSTRFVAVRIRSSQPFVCSDVSWTVYNLK
jgi:hypothetical protein